MTALEMKPEIRGRWVAALRSGEVPQALEVLRNDAGGRCCLGVLCDLAVKDGVIPPPERHPLDGSWQYAGEGTELPLEVLEWAGLRERNPFLPAGAIMNGAGSLGELNDGDDACERPPWTFAQIANLIEGTGQDRAAGGAA